MTLFLVISGSLYFILIGLFYLGWLKTPSPVFNRSHSHTKVSLIIPFRNEESNLLNLIQNLIAQDYPAELTEIIAVDDHSTDTSVQIIKSCNIPNLKIINLPVNITGKKAALTAGSEIATGELIITTDADCIPMPGWIKTLVSFYKTYNSKMLIGPVQLTTANTFFSKFQNIEFQSLQGSTAGAIALNHPIMCNGANLAFPRECLPTIQETYKNTNIASGDDIFALLAVHKKFPGRIHYIKSPDAVVLTETTKSIKYFFLQRRRWAAKAKFYTDPFLVCTSAIVLSTNILLLISLIYSFITNNWYGFLFLFLIKSIIDFPFLYSISGFFKEKKLMWWFPVFQSFYFLYISITFVISLYGGYTWKSRKIRA